jgi:O-antigen/teichoic acid export membrane protein
MTSIERQAIAGLKWGLAAKLLIQVFSWGVTIFVIRLLVPTDYGLMALCAVVLAIVAGVAELGLGASLVQARNLAKGDLARVAGMLLLLNLACAAIVVLAAPLFAGVFEHPRLAAIIRVSSAQLLLAALAAIPEALAYRDMRFKLLAAVDTASAFVTSATTLALAYYGAGVWALVLGNLAGSAVRTVLLIARSPFVRPTFDLRGVGRFLRFGGAWSGARFAWQLTYQADVLIAGRFLGEASVGTYSVAAQLANLPLSKAMGIVNQVAFPAIARLQDELPRMRTRVMDGIRMLGFCAIPVLFGLSAVAPEFVHVVLGERWTSVIVPLQIIALVAPLRMLGTLLATAVSAIGRADVELVNTLVSLAVFVTAFLLGVRFDVTGLAVAYAIAVMASFILNFSRTARVVGVSFREIGLACGSTVIAGTAMLGGVAGARVLLGGTAEWLRLGLLVVAGAVSHLGVLALLDRALFGKARDVLVALRGTP